MYVDPFAKSAKIPNVLFHKISQFFPILSDIAVESESAINCKQSN